MIAPSKNDCSLILGAIITEDLAQLNELSLSLANHRVHRVPPAVLLGSIADECGKSVYQGHFVG
jgi:hypothetical protein